MAKGATIKQWIKRRPLLLVLGGVALIVVVVYFANRVQTSSSSYKAGYSAGQQMTELAGSYEATVECQQVELDAQANGYYYEGGQVKAGSVSKRDFMAGCKAGAKQ